LEVPKRGVGSLLCRARSAGLRWRWDGWRDLGGRDPRCSRLFDSLLGSFLLLCCLPCSSFLLCCLPGCSLLCCPPDGSLFFCLLGSVRLPLSFSLPLFSSFSLRDSSAMVERHRRSSTWSFTSVRCSSSLRPDADPVRAPDPSDVSAFSALPAEAGPARDGGACAVASACLLLPAPPSDLPD
jgi:hypothetical protein